MRHLLINLTFILALIICSSTDAFSQRGGIVDIFGLVYNAEIAVETGGIGISNLTYSRIRVEISEDKEGDVLEEYELIYNTANSDSSIQLPEDINDALDGKYYVKVWMNEAFLGGQYKEDF